MYEVDEIVEELLKEKKGVKETVTEMKNISELMVDLAYSALLFNNDRLAEEVHELEEEMNKLRFQIEINTMLAARTPEQAMKLEGILHVAAAAERISNAAKELAGVVLRDIEVHPALKAALEEADEVVEKFTIGSSSKLVGETVHELITDPEYGVDIISIKRKGKWMFKVHDDEKLKANDTVIVTGFNERVEKLKSLAHPEK
jgi:uncharacterized protein with PhoU and TrkA domain